MSFDRPVVGITMGDINGIGPELIMKTFADPRMLKFSIPVIYGSIKILGKYKKLLNQDEFPIHQVRGQEGINPKKVNLIPCWDEDVEITPGKMTPEGGKYALISLTRATDDAIAGKLDALVTGPIHKANIHSNEFPFAGHTEFLAKKCNVTDNLMLLVSEGLRVGVVTTHVPLTQVKAQLTKERILSKINILYKSLKNDFGIQKPKIAMLGLNPHAGEDGLMGTEEKELLIPIAEDLKNKGILMFGPFPADGFFGSRAYKKFDGIIGMYHDQGLIPFKTLAFDHGVNFTAGLPIVRTSPDHGTAFDIAGKGIADESSFREALYVACEISKIRKPVAV